MKGFGFVKFVVSVLVASLFSVAFAYYGAYYLASNGSHMAQWSAENQYVTDVDGHKTTIVKRGSGFIIHGDLTRYPYDCYSMYSTLMTSDNASYQFPIRLSTMIVKDVAKVHLPIYLEIPKSLPAGHYTISQHAFPTCSSFQIPPFDVGLKVEIDVVD